MKLGQRIGRDSVETGARKRHWLSRSEGLTTNRGFASLAIILIIVGVSVIAGICYFFVDRQGSSQIRPEHPAARNTIDPLKLRPLIQNAIPRYANLPELGLVPTQTNIPAVNVSSTYSRFSYFGITFNVPWKDPPSIASSPDGSLVFLRVSPSHKVIEVFASSTLVVALAREARAAYLSGLQEGSRNTINTLDDLGIHRWGDSNYHFIYASLYSSPDKLSQADLPPNESLIVATGLLRTKKQITDALPIERLSTIYSFAIPGINGFQFVGTLTDGTTTYRASDVLVFNNEDEPSNLLTLGATQEEDNFILATLRTN